MDDKIFDPSRIDQRVRLGAVEEWTIRNAQQHDDHMFHIHTNPFQVIEIGGVPQLDRTWRDTVVVPRPAAGGSAVIRSRFLDYTGVFMMHCHMMNHEDLGMMQAVEVYKESDRSGLYEGENIWGDAAICSPPKSKRKAHPKERVDPLPRRRYSNATSMKLPPKPNAISYPSCVGLAPPRYFIARAGGARWIQTRDISCRTALGRSHRRPCQCRQ